MFQAPRMLRHALFAFTSAALMAIPLVGQQAEASKPAVSGPENFEAGERGSFVRQRMDWEYRQRAYPLKHIPSDARLRALREMDAKLARQAAARARMGATVKPGVPVGSWEMIGPQPEENVFWGPNSGRVTAIAVDPTNFNVVYTGAAQGGVWKTTDGGTTWTPLTDNQASLATGAMTLDPQNHNTIYVGTGEDNNSGDSYYGAGILKSTDGGATWTNIPGPFAGGPYGGARIGGIAVQPNNSNVVLVTTGCCALNGGGGFSNGVFRSADAGSTWTQVLSLSAAQAYNVIFDPATPNTVYASFDGNGVYRSTDGGNTWAADNGSGTTALPTTGTERVALAMDPNVTTTLYAGVVKGDFSGLLGLYKTINGGTSWTQLTNAPDYCGGQCWYDNVIAVQPGNSNVIVAGGDNGTHVTVSTDGGNTWTAHNSIHPDLHALVFTPDGAKLYLGNDGGMYSTTSVTAVSPTFANLNNGLATLQFYGGASINPNNMNAGFGGTQDNLSNAYNGTLGWQDVDCGDGGTTVIDFSNTNNVYINCVGPTLDKSTDGGATVSSATNGINTSDPTNWVPPLVMDSNNAQNLYFGTNHVYQTINGAGVWTQISPDLTGGNNASLVALAIAPTNSNTIYAGTGDDHLQVTTNALSGATATWTNISSATTLPPRSITAIAADPGVSTTAYVAFSGFSGFGGDTLGHVFKTTNGGTNWSDISGDLPNIPVNSIIVDSTIANTIYVGTDIGVFYTTSGGVSWSALLSGFPRVAVYGLTFQASTHTLWAVTHGRSVWATNVASVTGQPAVTSISPTSEPVGSGTFTLTVNGIDFNSGAAVQWNGTPLTTTFVSTTQLTATVPASDLLTAGNVSVDVANSGGQVSNPANFAIDNPVPATTSISPTKADVNSGGFTLTVNGSSFLNGSTVQWKGAALTTTFGSSSQLTAAVPSADLATAGMVNVTVVNPAPGGGVSGAQTFTIDNVAPTLTSVAPATKGEGGATFTLTANGSGFVSGAVVKWNGAVLITTFKSGVKVTASVPATDIAKAGIYPVTVTNPAPGGGPSSAMNVTVTNPYPKITTLSPNTKPAGAAAFTLTVNGSNLVSTSVVNWNGSPRTTTFVSATKLTAAITATDVATGGTYKVTVTSPAPGGGTAVSVPLTVNNPAPTLASISPTSALAGGAAFTLTATGTNYVSGAKINWNGTALVTTFVSSTSLTATVPGADIKNAVTATVMVTNPAPGGGTTGGKTFNINNPVPVVNTLVPSSATHGGAGFTLAIYGTGFGGSSVVDWNGSARTTTYVNPSKLTAAITAADIATAGTANVTVVNPAPGGGTSGVAKFAIK